MIKYEEKYVIYIDLLGFSNFVAKSSRENGEFSCVENRSCEEVYKVLKNAIECYENSNYKDLDFKEDKNGCLDIYFENGGLAIKKIVGKDCEITYCSDSVFISINCNIIALNIKRYIAAVQFTLLQSGILIRGGISYGKVYHDKNIIYGPAVIESIELEKNIGDPFIGVSIEAQNLLNENSDKFDFLEYYHPNGMIDMLGEVAQGVETILENLEDKIKNDIKELSSESDKIAKKLKSLKQYFLTKILEAIVKIDKKLDEIGEIIDPLNSLSYGDKELLENIKTTYTNLINNYEEK
jgi:hypothetical protein